MDTTSFESHLGPARERYLGHGYRNVRHELNMGACFGNDIGKRPVANLPHASIQYPDNWSVKGDKLLKPHLTTMDGIVIGARLVECLLARRFSAQDVSNSWISSVAVRAGAKPVEDTDSIPVSHHATDNGGALDVEARIGNMSVSLSAELPTSSSASVATAEEPTLPASGLYHEKYKSFRFQSSVLDLDINERRITTEHTMLASPEQRLEGLEGRTCTSLTYMDLMRLSAQAAQILIYAIDDITRTNANTLWMRRARFAATQAERPLNQPFQLGLWVTKERTIVRSNATWRTYDVAIVADDVMRSSASLAYALPV